MNLKFISRCSNKYQSINLLKSVKKVILKSSGIKRKSHWKILYWVILKQVLHLITILNLILKPIITSEAAKS